MYLKLALIFRLHFKLIIFWNVLLSVAIAYVFYLKGLDAYPLYTLALMTKFVGYGTSVALEVVLFAKRAYYFQNIGLSYKKIFSLLFLADFLLFCLMLLGCGLILIG